MTEPAAGEAVVERDGAGPTRPEEAQAEPRDPGGAGGRAPNPWRVAALFVLPYLLLGLAWAFSNPPGAAPDESAHLIKALGMAHLDIGTKYEGPASGTRPVDLRNASITRVVSIPARLVPTGYSCTAFQPTKPATCLPTQAPQGSGSVQATTSIGAYPPFLYLPLGLAATPASDPAQAFLFARLAALLGSCALLLLGASHIVRWLGRKYLVGALLALTPMAVFAMSMVSASGFEITAAFGVAAVAVVGLRRPESLAQPLTHLILGVTGCTLVLSRQLGAVAFAILFVLMVVLAGWRQLVEIVRRRQASLIATAAALALSYVAVGLWELRFDHPYQTGSPFSLAAWRAFIDRGDPLLESGVGTFGWLDSRLPLWCTIAWSVLAVLLLTLALLVGTRKERWALAGLLAVTFVLAGVTYATAFYPVQAGLQGRHVLPLFVASPMLAGVIVVGRLSELRLVLEQRRLIASVGIVMGVLQAFSVYWNGRRYATGTGGPLFYVGHSSWRPAVGGWLPWLVLALVGGVVLVLFSLRSMPPRADHPARSTDDLSEPPATAEAGDVTRGEPSHVAG
jgi:hypothetical protein